MPPLVGLPVPAGFTISTEACDYYYKNGKKYPSELQKQVAANVTRLQKVTGKKLRAQYARDESILGGAIVKVGSTIYDGSVLGQLNKIREHLVQSGS